MIREGFRTKVQQQLTQRSRLRFATLKIQRVFLATIWFSLILWILIANGGVCYITTLDFGYATVNWHCAGGDHFWILGKERSEAFTTKCVDVGN
jgi:hypothetical protein